MKKDKELLELAGRYMTEITDISPNDLLDFLNSIKSYRLDVGFKNLLSILYHEYSMTEAEKVAEKKDLEDFLDLNQEDF